MTAESNKKSESCNSRSRAENGAKAKSGVFGEVLPSIYRQRTPKTDIETNPIQRPRIERRCKDKAGVAKP